MSRSVNTLPPQSKAQRAAILRLLVDARGAEVPLPEIMAYAAQYNARIFELRQMGFNIPKPRMELVNGQRHTWYRLLSSPASSAPPPPLPTPEPEPVKSDSRHERAKQFEHEFHVRPAPVAATSDLPLFAGSSL